jgi:glycosyltransferase involved in cell wall biosynthesis
MKLNNIKLSVALIVKDEAKILSKCLDSVKDADSIIVVDTGSTDKTIEIAKKYTDKIYHFPWVNDFSKVRNFAKEKCTGDWIYSIDADHQLLTPISHVKEVISKTKNRVLNIKSKSGINWHYRAVLFKNDPDIKWVGKVHENLNILGEENTEIERNCDYSDNHKKNPERNLNILKTMEKTPRILFYLAKEYLDLKQYDKAIETFDQYLKVATWLDEKAEAYYYKAKAQWKTNQGAKARETNFEAIKLNPDMKKALELASEMHFEPWKSKWANLSKVATNKNVIFK